MTAPEARPYILAETSYAHAKANPYRVAVLPLGATEPHNLHLPYGTDSYEAAAIGERICAAAHERGAAVTLLPTIPYGTETNLAHFPLAMNLHPSTMLHVIRDLVESLDRSSVHRLLILNSHGGNDLKPLLREMYGRTPVSLFLCNWYQMVQDEYATIFERPDDHAGEMETSLALAYFPHLVSRDSSGALMADNGDKATTRFRAVNEGWVAITRPWHLLTTNSGAGNPHAATAEKGEALMELIVGRLAEFLVELSDTELDDHFPFWPE